MKLNFLHFFPIFTQFLIIFCADDSESNHILISSIELENVQISCDKIELAINGKALNATCHQDRANHTFYLAKPNSYPDSNLTIRLNSMEFQSFFHGILLIDEHSLVNSMQSTNLILEKENSPTTLSPQTSKATTVQSTKTTLSATTRRNSVNLISTPSNITININWLLLHVEIVNTKHVENKNGGAVTVAIIEGFALIGILGYFGFKIMKAQKLKNSTNSATSFGYNNNGIGLNDIPPAREPISSAQQSAPTAAASRITIGQPDLVVPSSSLSQLPSQNRNSVFNDPFTSLDSW